MITLIHGEDTTASRNYYFDIKQKSQGSLTLDGATITLTDLQQAVSGSDLFGNSKDIFVENLLSKRKSSKDIQELVSIINASSSPIFLWESKELTPKQVSSFTKATVKLFKIPSTIFALLDALKPGNGQQLITLFHQTLMDKDPEFVVVMLQRQVRILLALSSVIASEARQSQSISEISRLAPWQKGKLDKQAKQFTEEELLNLHEKLFQLELEMKTGGLSQPLENEIDLLFFSI